MFFKHCHITNIIFNMNVINLFKSFLQFMLNIFFLYIKVEASFNVFYINQKIVVISI